MLRRSDYPSGSFQYMLENKFEIEVLLPVEFFEQQGNNIMDCNDLISSEQNRLKLACNEDRRPPILQAEVIRKQQPKEMTSESMIGRHEPGHEAHLASLGETDFLEMFSATSIQVYDKMTITLKIGEFSDEIESVHTDAINIFADVCHVNDDC